MYQPLADKIRPTELDDVVGQSHIIGKDGVLRRIIESKVSKVGSGFYGDFEEYGLYIFCKDNLTEEDVIMTMEYTSDLQRHLDIKYSTMYLSLIDRLYVCDLTDVDRTAHPTKCASHEITPGMRRLFFMQAFITD